MGVRYQKLNLIAKLIFASLALAMVLSSGFSCAAASNLPVGLDKAFKTGNNTPLDSAAVQGGGFNTSATLETIISQVITMVLGLIGVIFLILAIYGGYTWMMAAGNEEKVEKAKDTIKHAIIGLIIVLAAYALSWFIVNVFGSIAFKDADNNYDSSGNFIIP